MTPVFPQTVLVTYSPYGAMRTHMGSPTCPINTRIKKMTAVPASTTTKLGCTIPSSGAFSARIRWCRIPRTHKISIATVAGATIRCAIPIRRVTTPSVINRADRRCATTTTCRIPVRMWRFCSEGIAGCAVSSAAPCPERMCVWKMVAGSSCPIEGGFGCV